MEVTLLSSLMAPTGLSSASRSPAPWVLPRTFVLTAAAMIWQSIYARGLKGPDPQPDGWLTSVDLALHSPSCSCCWKY